MSAWSSLPLVRAVFADDGAGARAALRAAGGFLVEAPTVPPGHYAPRDGALTLGELEARARSWESFDRAMRRTRDAAPADLASFLAATGLVPASFAECVAVRAPGGEVVRATTRVWTEAATLRVEAERLREFEARAHLLL